MITSIIITTAKTTNFSRIQWACNKHTAQSGKKLPKTVFNFSVRIMSFRRFVFIMILINIKQSREESIHCACKDMNSKTFANDNDL